MIKYFLIAMAAVLFIQQSLAQNLKDSLKNLSDHDLGMYYLKAKQTAEGHWVGLAGRRHCNGSRWR